MAKRSRENSGFLPQPSSRQAWYGGALGAVLVSFAVAAFDASAYGSTDEPARVLILYSGERLQPGAIVTEEAFRTTLDTQTPRTIQYYYEAVDVHRNPSLEYESAFVRYLSEKYGPQKPDLIFAIQIYALEFIERNRAVVGPNTPVVFASVDAQAFRDLGDQKGITGITESVDWAGTLDLAVRLQPDARRIVVVGGASEFDKRWNPRVEQALARFGDRFTVSFLTDRSTEQMAEELSRLGRDTIVLHTTVFGDAAGRTYAPAEIAGRLAAVASAPSYGAFSTYVGKGVVGGAVIDIAAQGRSAAGLAARILGGERVADIPAHPIKDVTIVDSRQMERWGLNESRLPPDTIVQFREPTAWDKYRTEISLAVAILLVQAGLIGALLVERRARRRTAVALEESQQQMSLAVGAARLSPWIWDTAHEKNRATPQRQHSVDASSERPVAFEQVLASVHPADRETLSRAVWRAQRTGEELDVEYRVVDQEGAVRWISARGRAEGGQSMRLLGVALDITERKAADLRAAHDRDALRHMSRVSTIGQLSAAIAHQLNQPLAAILGNAEAAQKMLGRENLDLTELREICKDIISADHRASEVIRRLNELYKRGDVKVEPIDLNELIRGTLELLHTELVIRHVTPVTDFSPALPKIEGGHVQLQQVVLNLVLNAADAMGNVKPEERRLAVRTDANGVDVRLYVVDNGSGIAPEHLNTVFNPFWSTKDGGMGMGLAICRSIVASHRGTITTVNNADGGATFCVSLPASRHA